MDVTLAQSKSISSRSQCLARSSELCDLSDIGDNRGYLRILFHDNMANILNCESELLVFQGFCCFRLIFLPRHCSYSFGPNANQYPFVHVRYIATHFLRNCIELFPFSGFCRYISSHSRIDFD